MKQIKFMFFCALYGLTVTHVSGAGLLEGLQELTQSIAGPLAAVFDAVTFCLTPFESVGCDDQAEWYEIIFEKRTRFYLFTRKNPSNPEFLHHCGGRLPKNTNFDPKDRTEIIVHGWLDGICRTGWMLEVKDELLKRGSYNVIFVEWTWGNGPEYYYAANNVYVVKNNLASLIKNIMMDSGVGPENVHIVGHSFGAHIAGLAGKLIPDLRRVTALDPALEPFQDKPATERLNATDAKLVDTIHSGAGTTPGLTFGEVRPSGDADFYPNGGTIQKSCVPYIIKSFAKLDLLYGLITILPNFCNHLQSLQYYKTSINPTECEFIGVQCSDYESFKSGKCGSCGTERSKCAVMGMNFEYKKHPTPNKKRYRKYYLKTTLFSPYCEK